MQIIRCWKRCGSGLGFNSGNAANGSNRNDDSDENDDNSFLPTAFGKKIKEGAMRRERERERERLEKKRGKHQSAGQDVSGDVGKFEKHTKGIGLKLLEKMGYKFYIWINVLPLRGCFVGLAPFLFCNFAFCVYPKDVTKQNFNYL